MMPQPSECVDHTTSLAQPAQDAGYHCVQTCYHCAPCHSDGRWLEVWHGTPFEEGSRLARSWEVLDVGEGTNVPDLLMEAGALNPSDLANYEPTHE